MVHLGLDLPGILSSPPLARGLCTVALAGQYSDKTSALSYPTVTKNDGVLFTVGHFQNKKCSRLQCEDIINSELLFCPYLNLIAYIFCSENMPPSSPA